MLSGRVDVVVAEALDRLSRDQEDMAGIFKRLSFAEVKLITLSEGEITELHVGLKGTMNALYLKDLADKTRRGLRGRVEAGRSGGGNSFGYDVVPGSEGDRGRRRINGGETKIVTRIFQEYGAGKSPRKIAFDLNRDSIPGPAGRDWGPSTINGNRARGTGILNNELYIGRMVWNRLRYIKNPDTGKRVSKLNSPEDWIIHDVPDLRVVDQDLWDAVKARQEAVRKNNREKVEDLSSLLDDPQFKGEAFDIIRSLIDEVRLVPKGGNLHIELKGELAGILNLCDAKKKPAASYEERAEQIKMVAGVGLALKLTTPTCTISLIKDPKHRTRRAA